MRALAFGVGIGVLGVAILAPSAVSARAPLDLVTIGVSDTFTPPNKDVRKESVYLASSMKRKIGTSTLTCVYQRDDRPLKRGEPLQSGTSAKCTVLFNLQNGTIKGTTTIPKTKAGMRGGRFVITSGSGDYAGAKGSGVYTNHPNTNRTTQHIVFTS